jgi:hypothetical protein
MRKVIPVAVLVAALFVAPAAFAASSPTVTVGATTGIGQTNGTVHGTVNANGLATTYQFWYGPTTALGKAVPATAGSVGSGTTVVNVSNRIGGLSPATTYYYELVASNADGASTSPIQSFKTTGNPAPLSTTNFATNVGRNFATLVGTITPNNQATTYFFQYGLTTSYGFQTNVGSIPIGTAPVPVTAVLPGLASGTVYHYRLVSSHGATATTYGNDMTFETLPWPRRHTALVLGLQWHSAGFRAVRVSAKGNIGLSARTAATVGCQGTVTVKYYSGKHRLATRKVLVGPRCGFRASARIRFHDAMRLRVKASFSGNAYQAPVNRFAQVKLG